MTAVLPTDAAERKAVPLAEGLLYYFPNALMEVARVSKRGNDQHNPNEPLHWAMEKSTDHADCIMRHLADAGTRDKDGMRHSGKVAWRALALLESELIAEGATPGRNAIRSPKPDYDPASVAFRAADQSQADKAFAGDAGADLWREMRRDEIASYHHAGIGDVAHEPHPHEQPGDLDDLRRERNGLPTAAEIADADGAGVVTQTTNAVNRTTAAELAAADGCAEYGNPVTPGCATPARQSDSWGVSYGGKRP